MPSDVYRQIERLVDVIVLQAASEKQSDAQLSGEPSFSVFITIISEQGLYDADQALHTPGQKGMLIGIRVLNKIK